ncbi:MAG: hypothetical protein DWQ36_04510 [Acidobacteria bacterium]|nr:MAG: hypothetical protein DWQ30_22000 [Acidobacteriota bacterium]REK10415.1 MAG: hypothetical protein DWQ36_04510 [Acidobacteriota bacterium]
MKHSTRIAIVWWLGCSALVVVVLALWTGHLVDRSSGLPLLHMATGSLAAWAVLLTASWFGFFSVLANGWRAGRLDLLLGLLSCAVLIAASAWGFLAWEELDRVAGHRLLGWIALATAIATWSWFLRRRGQWFGGDDR